ncbi:MAG: hypothetical protein EP317_02795 [Bacillota bacterium]|nr:MAG: hypothetical protein EP317_02795 [Bacillota bacterium]
MTCQSFSDGYLETNCEAVKLSFSKARIAVDSFHVIRTLNDVMRTIRIKVMNKYRLGKNDLEHDVVIITCSRSFIIFL